MAQQTNQQIQRQQQVQQVQTFADLLKKYRADFLQVIPKRLDGERIIRVAQSALARDRKLLAADPVTVMQGVMQAATLGLEIGILGEAYLVPYKNGAKSRAANRDVYDATFIPGYRGLVKLAYRSEMIDALTANVVREGDEFDFSDGSKPFLHHKKKIRNERAEPQQQGQSAEEAENLEIIAAYMVAFPRGSAIPKFEVMDRRDILRIRSRSRASNDGPWVSDFAEMARKCPVRRGVKLLPLAADFGRAVAHEERVELGEGVKDLFPELPERLPGEEEQQGPQSTVDAAAAALGAGGKATDVAGLDAEAEAQAKQQGQRRREPGEEG